MPDVVSRIATSSSSSSSSSICRFTFCRPKTNLLIYCRLNYFTVVFDVAASTFSMCRYFAIFLHNLAAAFECSVFALVFIRILLLFSFHPFVIVVVFFFKFFLSHASCGVCLACGKPCA